MPIKKLVDLHCRYCCSLAVKVCSFMSQKMQKLSQATPVLEQHMVICCISFLAKYEVKYRYTGCPTDKGNILPVYTASKK